MVQRMGAEQITRGLYQWLDERRGSGQLADTYNYFSELNIAIALAVSGVTIFLL
jgi:hypothetical protein